MYYWPINGLERVNNVGELLSHVQLHPYVTACSWLCTHRIVDINLEQLPQHKCLRHNALNALINIQ